MIRLRPDARDARFLRRLLLTAIAIAVSTFLVRAANLILLAFGALIVAVLLSTIADWFAERSRLPRWIGLALAAAALFLLIGAIGWLFSAETGREAGKLLQTLPKDWQAVQAWIGATSVGRLVLSSGQQGAGSGRLAQWLFGAGWTVSEIVINFLIVVIGAVFFAADPQVYRRGLILLAPPPYRASVADALDDSAVALRLWLWTQLFSMVAMGAMIALGLYFSGLEGWGALGVLGGLSEFIPYVGPTIAMIPALVIALAGQGSVWGVLGTYAAVRIAQANVITPLLSQRVVKIPPGLYIFTILSMAAVFGSFAMFFSGALSVVAFTLVRSLYLRDTLGDPIPRPGE